MSEGKIWTEEQLAILRAKYPTCHVKIPELLCTFTESQIRKKAHKLGLTDRRVSTTVNLLGKSFSLNKAMDVLGITRASVSDVARKYNLSECDAFSYIVEHFFILTVRPFIRTAKYFALDECKYLHREGKSWSLRAYVKFHSVSWSCSAPERYVSSFGFSTDDAVAYVEGTVLEREKIKNKYKASSLVMTYFTKNEDSVIIQNVHLTCEEIAQLLPGRDAASIYARARALNIRLRYRVPNTATGFTLSNKEIKRVSFAYTGTNDIDYFFCRCNICGRVSLVSLIDIRSFRHDDYCSRFCIPDSFIPTEIRERLYR